MALSANSMCSFAFCLVPVRPSPHPITQVMACLDLCGKLRYSRSVSVAGLAGLARLAGSSVWIPGFVGRGLKACRRSERSADLDNARIIAKHFPTMFKKCFKCHNLFLNIYD